MRSAGLIARSGCDTVGIDINNFQLEYPLMALVRERRPAIRFLHTAVMNPSRIYRPPVETPPCVIVCLDCSGDTSRLSLYGEFANAAVFGKFVVLSTNDPAARINFGRAGCEAGRARNTAGPCAG